MKKQRSPLWRLLRMLVAVFLFLVLALAALLWMNWPAAVPSERERNTYERDYLSRPIADYERPLQLAFDRIVARIGQLAPDYPQLSGFPGKADFGRLSFEFKNQSGDPATACTLSLKLYWRADYLRHEHRMQEYSERIYEEYKARGTVVFQTINRQLEVAATNGLVTPGSVDIIPNEVSCILRFFADPQQASAQELAAKLSKILEEEAARIRPELEPFVDKHGTPSLPDAIREEDSSGTPSP